MGLLSFLFAQDGMDGMEYVAAEDGRKPAVKTKGNARIILALIVAVVMLLVTVCVSGGMAGSVVRRFFRQSIPPAKKTRTAQRQLMQVRGRDVWVCYPAFASRDASLPVVIALHASEQTSSAFIETTMLDRFVESESFLAVFPEMPVPAGDNYGFGDSAEMHFFSELLVALGHHFTFNKDEVFVVGHSNGGSHALILQNNAPHMFRAAAAVEAGTPSNLTAYHWNISSRGGPVMLVMNKNDPVLAATWTWPGCAGCSAYNRSLQVLRRHDAMNLAPASVKKIQYSSPVIAYANELYWPQQGMQPALAVIAWETLVPTHMWPNERNIPGAFDVTSRVLSFFKMIMSDKNEKGSGLTASGARSLPDEAAAWSHVTCDCNDMARWGIVDRTQTKMVGEDKIVKK